MKRSIILVILTFMLVIPGVFTPRAVAFEPITVALLAPVALKVYEAAEPRLVRGAAAGGRKMLQIGANLVDIFRLPLGAIQMTLGAPFGFFGDGVSNIAKGAIAPVKMVGNILVLPFALFGVNL
ncbi:MAG: hypothetical protein E7039_00630 [Lentisphaerae bacterium]|nr:hypothetical protein [Lentisphaerota bacterium]